MMEEVLLHLIDNEVWASNEDYNRKEGNRPLFYYKFISVLYCKTLTTATGATCIWVAEMKAFTVEPVRKIKRGIAEIKETFKVGN